MAANQFLENLLLQLTSQWYFEKLEFFLSKNTLYSKKCCSKH